MTSAAHPRKDPYYCDEPALWLREFVERHHGIKILIEDTLDPQDVAASRSERIIWVKPGLPFTTFRRYVSDSVIYILFGQDAAPMFSTEPRRPWLATSDGVALPNPA